MSPEIFGHSFTNSSDPNWVPEPGTRGTSSILSVCLVTLGLCVWTAIHLNVPEHMEPGWKQLMRKIGWLVFSLLSPELIAYTAYRQYVQARSIMNTMNEEKERSLRSRLLSIWRYIRGFLASWGLLPSRPSDEEAPRTTARKWTIVHGFLAVMGGIAIEMNDDDLQIHSTDRIMDFFPMKESTDIQWECGWPTLTKGQRQRSRLTLTLDGLRFLKEKGHDRLIPNVSEERIKDKSKGSAIAKTLVCFQASWFCVQCLTRFAQGLAISLLELNTLGHAICTLFIYALWWKKPLDIVEHETVLFHPSTNDDNLEQARLIATMCTRSKLDKRASESDHIQFGGEMFAFPVHCGTKDGSDSHVDLSGRPLREKRYRLNMRDMMPTPYYRERRSRKFDIHYGDEDTIILASFFETMFHGGINANIPRLYLSVKQSSALLEMVRLRPQKEHIVTLRSDNGGEGDWDGVKLLGRSIRDSTKMGPRSAFGSPDSSPNSTSTAQMPHVVIQYSDIIRWQLALGLAQHDLSTPPRDSFTDRVRNLPRFQDYDHYLSLFIGFGIVGLIYGGLHCVAWNAPFTTSIERIFWRMSSITIAATGVLVACVFSWTKFPPFWQEPIRLYEDIDDLWRDILDNKIFLWCTGIKLSNLLDKFVKRQPSYQNNRLVKALCDIAVTLLIYPTLLLFFSTVFLLYLLKILFDITTVLFGVLYVLARIYLVVISFINLAHLPDSAYLLPQWSRYVPHIG